MHELGIVMKVVEEAEAAAKQNEVNKVLKLTMEIGQVSSVVPELFTDAFDWAKKRTEHLKETELELVIIQAVSYCTECKKTYPTTKYAKICPHCGSEKTYLVTGDEILIKGLEVE